MTDRREEKQTIVAKALIAKYTVGRVTRLLQCVLLVAGSAVPLAGDDARKVGYIDCSLRDKHSLYPGVFPSLQPRTSGQPELWGKGRSAGARRTLAADRITQRWRAIYRF